VDPREDSLTRDPPHKLRSAEALSLPGRRVRTTAQRPWIDWAYARSDRFPPRGVTPLTPIMGRKTDPGENHDPGNDQRFTPSLTQVPRLENALYLRRVLGKRPAPEFEAWLERFGITDATGSLAGPERPDAISAPLRRLLDGLA
jgi:hypothetical protein